MKISMRKSLELNRFSPLNLFTGSEIGGWWDARDLSTLFTDILATTPVTLDGDNVKTWNDKSGRGNHVIETLNCPIYKSDMGGCVRFDGVNDVLSKLSSLGGLFSKSGCSTFAALKCNGALDDRIWGEGSSSTTTPVYAPMACNSTTATSMSGLIRNDAAGTMLASSQIQKTGVFDNIVRVLGVVVDHGISLASGYLNGDPTANFGFNTPYTGAATVDRFALGALVRTSTANFAEMDLYEIVIIGRVVTTAERTAVMRYLGRPRGIYF